QRRLPRRHHLRLGLFDLGARLKVDANDGDAVERLAFDVLDVVDGGGEEALEVADEAPFHLAGRHARVLPDHRDDRDVHRREDVGRHPEDRPSSAMAMAMTTKVYGRRSASRTIHITARVSFAVV